MRAEKVVRSLGLALFFLFPLLSVFQLRDTDGAWREAAQEARPSILGLHRVPSAQTAFDAGPAVGCGIVVQNSPLEIVVSSRLSGVPLASPTPDGWIRWTPRYTDPHGEFTLLQADVGGLGGAARRATRAAPAGALPTADLVLDPDGAVPGHVTAALVGPSEFSAQPLWVGVLTSGPTPSGRPGYFSGLLRPIRDLSALATTDAYAEPAPKIDPVLRGAPFVDESGAVVAIYVGQSARGAEALPIEVVAQTLVLLQLQAAH